MIQNINNIDQRNEKGWKIATVVVSIIAVCAVGLAIYGLIRNLQKDTQISDLETQIATFEKQDNNFKNAEINPYESVGIYYYAAADTNGNKYSLVLTLNNELRNGFFDLIQSNSSFSESVEGYIHVEDNNLTFSVGPFTQENDFTSSITISRDMNFSFTEDENEQNYKSYKTTMDEQGIMMGDILFGRIK